MRFLLLGPVKAIDEDKLVALGRRQERCLLGLLLVEAGRPVPLDRLADLLWDGQPPERGRQVIQTYIARLRARLAPHRVEIVTEGGGYRANVDPATVDVHEFLGLVARSRTAATERDRISDLDGALALWRGPVLMDVCSERTRDRIAAGLEQVRLAAVEERATDRLRRGDHQEVIAMLVDVVRARPAHERLVGLLMRAYTSAGRRGEALSLYRHTSRILLEQMGVPTSPTLRREYDRAMRDIQPSIATGTPTPDPPALFTPRELPAIPAGFVGRETERRRLVDALSRAGGNGGGRPSIVALHGPGGVGKSALAVVAAQEVKERYRDGQIYIDLCGSTPGVPSLTALDAVGHGLRSLGVSPMDIPRNATEASAQLQSRLDGMRLLVVLDNADDPLVVRTMTPATAGCGMIVTSRIRYTTVDSDLDMEVNPLARAEATRLLFRHAGRVSNGRAVDRIVELCEFLPLALRLAAARLVDRTGLGFEEFAASLADQRQRLDLLDLQGLAIRSSVQVSYDGLRNSTDTVDRGAAGVFARLGLLPVPEMSTASVAALMGNTDLSYAHRMLLRLADMHLVRPVDEARYAMHDLVRLFAIERASLDLAAEDREPAIDRGLAHFVTSSARLSTFLLPGRPRQGAAFEPRDDVLLARIDSADAAVAWLDREVPALLAIAEHVAGDFAPVTAAVALFPLDLSRALMWVLIKRGEWAAGRRLGQLAVRAAEKHGEGIDAADAYRLLGQAETHLNEDKAAIEHLEAALDLTRKAGDVFRQIGTLNDLGRVATQSNDLEVALGHTRDALALARQHGMPRPEGAILLNLSSIYASLSRWGDAQETLEESLQIRRAFDDDAGLAIVLPSLGSAHFMQDHLDDAMACFDEAVAVCSDVGNTVDGWFSHFGRALTHLALGNTVAALHDACLAVRVCGGNRPHEAAASLRLVALVVDRAGHEGIAARYDRHADLAYQALVGPMEPQIEAMLARAT